MAKEKTIQTRIINKHGLKTDWDKATNFIPKQGEFIVYDIDSVTPTPQLKIGDGVTNAKTLPFFKGEKGEKGDSGVYVGAGDIPEGYNIRINPQGESVEMPEVLQTTGYSTTDTMSQSAITKAIQGKIPAPSLKPIHFTGSTEAYYDGSKELTVDIPFASEIGGGGNGNYNTLSNKPYINGTELQGELSLSQLGIRQDYAEKKDIPKTLPSPNKLSITVNGIRSDYDGSKPISIGVPIPPVLEATGDAEITLTTQGDKGHILTATHTSHTKGSARTPSTKSFSAGTSGTLKIPKIETNETGHVTAILEETVTINMPSSSGGSSSGGNGKDGQDGATFTPSVNNLGILSWTNDKNLTNPQPFNLVQATLNALPTWNGGSY